MMEFMAHFYVQTKSKMRYKPQSQWMDGVIKLWGKRTRQGMEKKPDKSWQYDGHSVQISRSLPKDSCSM
jgi:hypothetical protein